jgi:hypothetical protein
MKQVYLYLDMFCFKQNVGYYNAKYIMAHAYYSPIYCNYFEYFKYHRGKPAAITRLSHVNGASGHKFPARCNIQAV